MKNEKLRLIVLKSALELGQKVDKHLQKLYHQKSSFIVPVKEDWFQDGHQKVTVEESVRGDDVFILQDIGNYSLTYEMHGFINHTSPNDLMQQLRDTIGACELSANSISIVTPLLFSARQHRKTAREALSCAATLRELDDDPKIRSLITFDAHDEGVQQAMTRTEFNNFFATNVVLESFINDTDAEQLKNVLFIAPDFGATGRRNFYLNAFSSPEIIKDAGSFYKIRDYNRVVDGKNPVIEHSYSGSSDIKGKTAIVIDDMISSGGSMFEVIDELKKRGVSHIYLIATHSLFTKGIERFKEYYDKGMFDGLYTTNLSYIDESYRNEKWLHIVDCSYYLAQIIYNLNEDLSISPLMKDKSYISNVLTKKFK